MAHFATKKEIHLALIALWNLDYTLKTSGQHISLPIIIVASKQRHMGVSWRPDGLICLPDSCYVFGSTPAEDHCCMFLHSLSFNHSSFICTAPFAQISAIQGALHMTDKPRIRKHKCKQ